MPLFECIVPLKGKEKEKEKEKGLRISKTVFSLNHTDIRNGRDSMRESLLVRHVAPIESTSTLKEGSC